MFLQLICKVVNLHPHFQVMGKFFEKICAYSSVPIKQKSVISFFIVDARKKIIIINCFFFAALVSPENFRDDS